MEAGSRSYPSPDGSVPTSDNPNSHVKVHLVDPWGRPFLYGWEIEVNAAGTARFHRAWIASRGPDRSFDARTWIGAAKAGGGYDSNADNIVP